MRVTLKIFPPFTGSLHTVERTYTLPGSPPGLIEVLRIAQSEGLLDSDKVIDENGEVREGAVILVNGRAVFSANCKLRSGRVVVMPLAPGG